MLIEIEESLFNKVLKIVKSRNIKVYEELNRIQAIEPHKDTITTARAIRTQRVKQTIKETIKTLIEANTNPTKYQINKVTGISYPTLKKYYKELLDEV